MNNLERLWISKHNISVSWILFSRLPVQPIAYATSEKGDGAASREAFRATPKLT